MWFFILPNFFNFILSGNPPPTIRWFLNGVDIAQNKNFRKRYRLLDQGHGLELQPTTQDDIGLWTCQAENAAGSSVANISLDVWGKYKFLSYSYTSLLY